MIQEFCPYQHQCEVYDDGKDFNLISKENDELLRKEKVCLFWNKEKAQCEDHEWKNEDWNYDGTKVRDKYYPTN